MYHAVLSFILDQSRGHGKSYFVGIHKFEWCIPFWESNKYSETFGVFGMPKEAAKVDSRGDMTPLVVQYSGIRSADLRLPTATCLKNHASWVVRFFALSFSDK